MRTHTTKLLSMDPKTKKGVGGSRPSISDDGSRVAFYSFASTLVPNDKNDLWDIFLWDSGNPNLKRLSMAIGGGERNQGQESASRVVTPTISGDGRYVAYSTTATNVVAEDMDKNQDVFVVEADSGRTVRASVGGGGARGPGDSPAGQGERIAISADGQWVAFTTTAAGFGGNVVMRSVATGETRVIQANPKIGVGPPAMSGRGGYVVFGAGDKLDMPLSVERHICRLDPHRRMQILP